MAKCFGLAKSVFENEEKLVSYNEVDDDVATDDGSQLTSK